MTEDDKPFTWGLTPGSEPEPTPPAEPPPPAPTEPFFPPTEPYTPPASPYPQQPHSPPPYLPPANVPPARYVPPALEPPTEPSPPSLDQWFSTPLDPALAGVSEVYEAELVGLTAPVGESLPFGESPEPSGLDDLFGAHQFQDVSDEPLIAPLVPRRSAGTGGAGGEGTRPPRQPRTAIPRTQKILMGVAGGLVAALALVALFELGTRIPNVFAAAPTASPTPTPTPSPTVIVYPAGPVAPGEHRWNDLLGGECLSPYQSPWQDVYTVVDCTVSHPAQLVFRSRFSDAPGVVYPGVDELQKRINSLCTAPTVINYAIAGTVQDIQIAASFPVDAAQWDSGDRTFFCFANRSGGEPLLASIAVQQVAVTMTPTPAP